MGGEPFVNVRVTSDTLVLDLHRRLEMELRYGETLMFADERLSFCSLGELSASSSTMASRRVSDGDVLCLVKVNDTRSLHSLVCQYGYSLRDLRARGAPPSVFTDMTLPPAVARRSTPHSFSSSVSGSSVVLPKEVALVQAGFSVEDLVADGFFPVVDGVAYPGHATRARKVSAFNFKRGGLSASELRMAGFGLNEMATAGFSVVDLLNAGYPRHLRSFVKAKFSLSALKEAGFEVSDHVLQIALQLSALKAKYRVEGVMNSGKRPDVRLLVQTLRLKTEMLDTSDGFTV